jgi:hypothetical protein
MLSLRVGDNFIEGVITRRSADSVGGSTMSFQAKVKKTGQLFVATNELDKDGAWNKDARKLEKGKSYVGYLFSAKSDVSGTLRKPEVEILESDALEELSVHIKLVVE